MKAHNQELRDKALELLSQSCGPKEISEQLGISIGAVEDWALEWRKAGLLKTYKRPRMAFVKEAKNLSNGYYQCIRKRWNGMQWTDKLNNRKFGFDSQVQAIHYFLKNGVPRPCSYCGRKPPEGKVWGLDRVDSSLGHTPGNLVPCCSDAKNPYLSCQTSKSKFTLLEWLEVSMRRALGKEVSKEVVERRVNEIITLAQELERT